MSSSIRSGAGSASTGSPATPLQSWACIQARAATRGSCRDAAVAPAAAQAERLGDDAAHADEVFRGGDPLGVDDGGGATASPQAGVVVEEQLTVPGRHAAGEDQRGGGAARRGGDLEEDQLPGGDPEAGGLQDEERAGHGSSSSAHRACFDSTELTEQVRGAPHEHEARRAWPRRSVYRAARHCRDDASRRHDPPDSFRISPIGIHLRFGLLLRGTDRWQAVDLSDTSLALKVPGSCLRGGCAPFDPPGVRTRSWTDDGVISCGHRDHLPRR